MLGMFFTACQKEDFVPQDDFAEQVTDDEDDGFDDDVFDDGEDSDGSGDDDFDDHSHDHDTDGGLSSYKVNGNSITLIQDYQVSENLKSYQDDKNRHQKIWEHITSLFPIQYRENIAEFEVFFGGGELSGYVVPLGEDDLSKWKIGMAIDMEGDLDDLNFQNWYTYVIIHEIGHILTLNDTQIELKDESDCSTYFTGEGCSKPDSYINRIYELGWADIIDQHDFENPQATYEQYEDRFQTDYAATNPGEDVAEVFAYFMMANEEPAGVNIAEQKIKILFEYPELLTLRKIIRDKVGPINAKISHPSLRGKMKKCSHNLLTENT